jgi:acyl carrier protein
MSPEAESTCERIKGIIVDSLRLEGLEPGKIDSDAPLFGDGLGLDSIDALELVVAMEKEFGVTISSEEVGKEAFGSVRALAAFVDTHRARKSGAAGR